MQGVRRIISYRNIRNRTSQMHNNLEYENPSAFHIRARYKYAHRMLPIAQSAQQTRQTLVLWLGESLVQQKSSVVADLYKDAGTDDWFLHWIVEPIVD